MKYFGMLLVGIVGFIIGEAISKAIRSDTSTKGDDSTLSWFLKIIIALSFMIMVNEGCE